MTRKLLFQILSIFTVVLILFAGCGGDDDSNPVTPGPTSGASSITLNGGGFSNTTINMPSSFAGYEVDYGQTYAVMFGAYNNDTMYVYLAIDGQSTGSQAWIPIDTVNQTYTGVLLQTGSGAGMKFYVPISGTTQVTAYGNVGQKITGTYTGTVQEMLGTQQIQVSGKFDALRGQ